MKADLFTYLMDMGHERESMRNIAREIYLIRTYHDSACYKLFGYKPKGESPIAMARGQFYASTMGDDRNNWRQYSSWSDW